MKRLLAAVLALCLFCLWGCHREPSPVVEDPFLRGADISSLISLENSGTVYRNSDGEEQDLLKILKDAGVNCIRIRVWNDPFDQNGNGYGGGNCDLENAVALGKRAAAYQMGVLLDLHYSDFWADPAKQQAPKEWQTMSLAEKALAVRSYTADCINRLEAEGVLLKIVQIGNEVNNGFCGETTVEGQYTLMAAAAEAARIASPGVKIAVHYTNPEKGAYGYYADTLNKYQVDYDIFATSYYPCWHGSPENLRSQLQTVIDKTDKQVMIAETSWPYTAGDTDGHPNSLSQQHAAGQLWDFSPEGQTQELADMLALIRDFGDLGAGVFYWEPGWIAVPGSTKEERSRLWEQYGSGWASSFSGEYDPTDAGQYYGGSACDNQALFDSDGFPLEALQTLGKG